MLNKQGGLEADLTVSTLGGDDAAVGADRALFPVSSVIWGHTHATCKEWLLFLFLPSSQPGHKGGSPVFYLNAAGGAAFHNLSHVRQTIQDAGFTDVRVDDVSRELGLLSLQGPESRRILGKVVEGGEAALSNEQFPFYTHKIIDVAGHKVKECF